MEGEEMSKQSEAKLAQGYASYSMKCSNCLYYSSDMQKVELTSGATWIAEKNKRCSMGGFAVKSSASCVMWKIKEA